MANPNVVRARRVTQRASQPGDASTQSGPGVHDALFVSFEVIFMEHATC